VPTFSLNQLQLSNLYRLICEDHLHFSLQSSSKLGQFSKNLKIFLVQTRGDFHNNEPQLACEQLNLQIFIPIFALFRQLFMLRPSGNYRKGVSSNKTIRRKTKPCRAKTSSKLGRKNLSLREQKYGQLRTAPADCV